MCLSRTARLHTVVAEGQTSGHARRALAVRRYGFHERLDHLLGHLVPHVATQLSVSPGTGAPGHVLAPPSPIPKVISPSAFRTRSTLATALAVALACAAISACQPSIATVDPAITGAFPLGAPGAGVEVLPAARRTTWRPGVTYDGGIPDRTKVCATIEAARFGDGAEEASRAIQEAVDRCPAGEVVALSVGRFRVNRHIRIDKGITLRGAGAGKTMLEKTNGAVMLSYKPQDAQPIVVVGPSRWPKADAATARPLAIDGEKGATSVTVRGAKGIAPGEIVLLDELSGAQWMPDPLGRGKIWAAPDWRVVWQLHEPRWRADDPLEPTTPTAGQAASWFSRRDRPVAELKEVQSVVGDVVTFTTPLHTDYRLVRAAELTRFTGNARHVSGVGVEALTVVGGSDGTIRFVSAARSWARNVEVTRWLGEGVAIDSSFRIEFRDSYVHDGAWSSPGGAGYALSLSNGSAEVLVENDILVNANKVMVARSAGAGSVVAYNYVDGGFILGAEGWIEVGLNASHMAGSHHVLFEGNDAFNFDSDKTHGSATRHTVFRNWLRGVRRPFVNPSTGHTVDDAASRRNGPKRCAGAGAYSYGMNYVGNVLGEQGKMAGWVYDGTGTNAMGKPSVWLLGWDDASPQPWDPNVAATALRVGNWDWLQERQSWEQGTPGRLPDSLYLAGKPDFFGAAPWPWVDPFTGRTGVLPARARLEAGTPNILH